MRCLVSFAQCAGIIFAGLPHRACRPALEWLGSYTLDQVLTMNSTSLESHSSLRNDPCNRPSIAVSEQMPAGYQSGLLQGVSNAALLIMSVGAVLPGTPAQHGPNCSSSPPGSVARQRVFQAPTAEDFNRGTLPSESHTLQDVKPSSPIWAAMFFCMSHLWARLFGSASPQ